MAKNIIHRLIREPLVHFIIIGSLVFILHNLFGTQDYIPDDNVIHVSWSTIESEMKQWENLMGRTASDEEVKGFIDKYINDEMLSREAISLGLDKGDIVIKRRLVQKIEFMRDDLFVFPDPTEDELKAYLRENAKNYTIPRQLSFVQILLKEMDAATDKRMDNAVILRDKLNDNSERPENAIRYTQSNLLEVEYKEVTPLEMLNLFGNEGLFDEMWDEVDQHWIGPYESVYGVHVMHITAREDSHIPALSKVRDRLAFDYITFKRAEAASSFMDNLKERYILKLDEKLDPYYNE